MEWPCGEKRKDLVGMREAVWAIYAVRDAIEPVITKLAKTELLQTCLYGYT